MSATPIRLILAEAGTGKTAYTLANVAQLLVAGTPPDAILVVTFNDDLARSLNEALDGHLTGQGRSAPALATTFSRLAARILAEPGPRHMPAAARPIDDPLERILLAEIIAQVLPAGDTVFDHLQRDRAFRDAVDDFILRLKLNKIDPDRFRSLTADMQPQAELRVLADIYDKYHTHLTKEGIVDFRGATWLALLRAQNEAQLHTRLSQRWQYIFVDEVQDATPVEIELLAEIAGEGTQVTLLGDPSQAVYSFRGAVAAQMQACVQGAFQRRGRSVKLASLPASQAPQCPPPVFALHRTIDEEARWIAGEIRSLIQDGSIPSERIAVLFRSYSELRTFMPLLVAEGLPVSAPVGGIGARVMSLLARSFLEFWDARDSLARQNLGENERRSLIETANSALQRIFTYVHPQPREFHLELERTARQAMVQRRLITDYGGWRTVLAGVPRAEPLRQILTAANSQKLAISDRLRRGISLLDLDRAIPPAALTEAMRCLFLLLDKLQQAEQLVSGYRAKTGGLPTARELLSDLDGFLPSGGNADQNGIQLLPAHQAKGRNFDAVFIPWLTEGVFPRRPLFQRVLSQDTLCELTQALRKDALQKGELAPVRGLIEDNAEALAEEKRLLHVCISRATKRLYLSAHLQDTSGLQRPSPLLIEQCALTFAEGFRSAQGSKCPLTPAVSKSAPTGGLSSCSECQLMQPPGTCCVGLAAEPPVPLQRRAVAVAEPSPVLSGVPYVFSATSINDYSKCPRKFFLSDLLHVEEEEESDGIALGIVAHRILKRIHEAAPPPDRATASAWVDEDFALQAFQFTSAVTREYQRGYFHEALADYFDRKLHERRMIAREIPFGDDTPALIAGHCFRGRIDAVAEGSDGRYILVDFKTSRSAYNATNPVTNILNLKLRFTDPVARTSLEPDYQLPIYALSGLQPLEDIGALELQFVRPSYATGGCIQVTLGLGKVASDVKLSYDELRAVEATIGELCTAIETADHFELNPAACGNGYTSKCPFSAICQVDQGDEE